MKFKVGDKVKHEDFGEGVVVETNSGFKKNAYLVQFKSQKRKLHDGNGVSNRIYKDEDVWFFSKNTIELKLIKSKQFTKSDLKDGDIVTYRNGNKRTIEGNILIDKDGFIMGTLKSYEDNLKHINVKENDIIKVERPVKYKTVFEREEEILDETEKRYLRNVIRPFRDTVRYIEKEDNGQISRIKICFDYLFMFFPTLEKEKRMYEGMQANRAYSIKELRNIKEGKQMNIEKYLSTEEFKTRGQLVEKTGMSDRLVRDEINKLRKIRPVISNSQTKGYKLAKDLNSFNTAEEAIEEMELIKYMVNENNSRAEDLKENNKVCEEYQQMLAERIIILENENHVPNIE